MLTIDSNIDIFTGSSIQALDGEGFHLALAPLQIHYRIVRHAVAPITIDINTQAAPCTRASGNSTGLKLRFARISVINRQCSARCQS